MTSVMCLRLQEAQFTSRILSSVPQAQSLGNISSNALEGHRPFCDLSCNVKFRIPCRTVCIFGQTNLRCGHFVASLYKQALILWLPVFRKKDLKNRSSIPRAQSPDLFPKLFLVRCEVCTQYPGFESKLAVPLHRFAMPGERSFLSSCPMPSAIAAEMYALSWNSQFKTLWIVWCWFERDVDGQKDSKGVTFWSFLAHGRWSTLSWA